jgi:hypothetical protein
VVRPSAVRICGSVLAQLAADQPALDAIVGQGQEFLGRHFARNFGNRHQRILPENSHNHR